MTKFDEAYNEGYRLGAASQEGAIAGAYRCGAISRDAEIAELNRKVFALKTPCAVALAALEDFNEQAKGRYIFIPAEIDFAIDRLKEVLK